jgi:hypothetical protein
LSELRETHDHEEPLWFTKLGYRYAMFAPERITSEESGACQRSFGRAPLSVRTFLTAPTGRIPCMVLDLSLGGARVEAAEAIGVGASVWLTLQKVTVFGEVKWSRGISCGIQFQEKLPKALVLSMRGELIDPEQLKDIEAKLAAQNWVVGNPVDRPKTARIAEVIGSRPSSSNPPGPSKRPARHTARGNSGADRRSLLIVISAALMGTLLGLGSVWFF